MTDMDEQKASSSQPISSGSVVRIKETGNAERDLMYRGWCGIVERIEGGKAWVDSDAYTRRTGKLQAVSFRGWFPLDHIELVQE